jgi:jumonji domain-containing protein 2
VSLRKQHFFINLIRKGLGEQKISGVNTPYVYVGSWKSMFGWHKEDLDLYSINYLHHGRAKFWYGINLDCNKQFEKFASSQFPAQAKDCSEFIRHKTTLFYPGVLLDNGVSLTKAV